MQLSVSAANDGLMRPGQPGPDVLLLGFKSVRQKTLFQPPPMALLSRYTLPVQ